MFVPTSPGTTRRPQPGSLGAFAPPLNACPTTPPRARHRHARTRGDRDALSRALHPRQRRDRHTAHPASTISAGADTDNHRRVSRAPLGIALATPFLCRYRLILRRSLLLDGRSPIREIREKLYTLAGKNESRSIAVCLFRNHRSALGGDQCTVAGTPASSSEAERLPDLMRLATVAVIGAAVELLLSL